MHRSSFSLATVGLAWLAAAGSARAQNLPPRTAPLADRIAAAVQLIQQDTCFQNTDGSTCTWADYRFTPGDFKMTSKTGADIPRGPGGAESIMVVDGFDPGSPVLVRYHNRIAAYYHINPGEDGLTLTQTAAHLPKQLGDVLSYFAGPEFIPASALTPVAQAASIYDKLGLTFLGHGGVVLGHLLDLVPEQPIVLVDMANLLALPPELCDGLDDDNLASARHHFAGLASSLRLAMVMNNVHYVNASFGSTADTVRSDWQSTCGTSPPDTAGVRTLLGLYAPLYDALFNTPGVIAAHAAASLGSAADFPFDQVNSSYPNQVRVGYFSSKSSGLNWDGTGTLSKNDQFPATGNADVFLNWECLLFGDCAPLHYECVANYGLLPVTLPIMSTSYISPLALGRLINLRNGLHAGVAMSNQLIGALRSDLIPSRCGSSQHDKCIYQDPLVFKFLEVYRLGYK
jgi:hypothetical protein